MINALNGVGRQLIFLVLGEQTQVAELVFIPNGRVRLKLFVLLKIARIIKNGILTVAKINAAGLLRLIGVTHARLVLVLLIKKQDLEHHLHAGWLIQVEVELLKYLEFGFHKHFGDEFNVALFFAKLGRLLKVEYAVLVHFHRKT